MHIAHVCKFNAICVYRCMNIAFGNFLHNSIQNMCVRKVMIIMLVKILMIMIIILVIMIKVIKIITMIIITGNGTTLWVSGSSSWGCE